MVHEKDPCPICQNQPKKIRHIVDMLRLFDCPRCGEFFIDSFAARHATQLQVEKRQRMIASSTIRTMQRCTITSENYQHLFDLPDKPVLEKIDNALLFLEKRTEILNSLVEIFVADLSLQAECWAMDEQEVQTIFNFLVEQGRIQGQPSPVGRPKRASITYKGWEYLESLHANKTAGSQSFVAMWFDEEVDHLFEKVFKPAIEQAGYSALRIDKKEHADRIDDEIIREIRRSRFVVADATGHRGGVYYEAGFAHGLGLPVFWTCREGENLHFDVRQYNCIFWKPDDLAAFRKALAVRIEAVLGKGPK